MLSTWPRKQAQPNGAVPTIDAEGPTQQRVHPAGAHTLIFAALPAAVLLLAVGAGFLKWQHAAISGALPASAEAAREATEGTVALLSYAPDTVSNDLVAVRDRLTGDFLAAFTSLADEVVIPSAKQQQIFSAASVPAAAAVSASPDHVVVLLFVNQTTTVADDPPTLTASSVTVTLEKVDGCWLISDFAPI